MAAITISEARSAGEVQRGGAPWLDQAVGRAVSARSHRGMAKVAQRGVRGDFKSRYNVFRKSITDCC